MWFKLITAPIIVGVFVFVGALIYEGLRSYESGESEKEARKKRNGAVAVVVLIAGAISIVAVLLLS